MLSLNEFSANRLTDIDALTLVLPRNKDEWAFLVAPCEDKMLAVFIEGEYKFEAEFIRPENVWAGITIPGVRLEVDERKTFSVQDSRPIPGTLIREDDKLEIFAKLGEGNFKTPRRLPIISGLPSTSSRVGVGFLRWAVCVGDGYSRRELVVVDIEKPAGW